MDSHRAQLAIGLNIQIFLTNQDPEDSPKPKLH